MKIKATRVIMVLLLRTTIRSSVQSFSLSSNSRMLLAYKRRQFSTSQMVSIPWRSRALWSANDGSSFVSFRPSKEQQWSYLRNSRLLPSHRFRLGSAIGGDMNGVTTENNSEEDNEELFDSPEEEENSEESSTELTDASAGQHQENENEIPTLEQEEQNPFAESLGKSIRKALKKKTKIQASLQSELDKAKNLESTVKRANLILSNLYQIKPGISIITVQDWDLDGKDVELTLNTKEYSSAQEEADALFAKAKKMKRGSVVVKELLEGVDEALEILQDAKMEFGATMKDEIQDSDLIQARLNLLLGRLESSSDHTGFELLQTVQKQQHKANSHPPGKKRKNTREPTFRRFKSPNGCVVLVGRNRRDNEAICFQVARGDDVWMHSRGCPGAHVLLQIRRGSPVPSNQDFQFAADLAAFYSDARTERKAPITTADAKHIQKPRGAPLGAVKVRQEREMWVGFPENVAEELKIAREESGVAWDEGGSRSLGGKAKNRKYTREVAKQALAKKRLKRKEKQKREGTGDADGEPWN